MPVVTSFKRIIGQIALYAGCYADREILAPHTSLATERRYWKTSR